MKKFNKIAFTLAEVLIVIGIIGIIADMTIPTLVRNVEISITVAKLKKHHSMISQAAMSMISEEGTMDTWSELLSANDQWAACPILHNKIKPYLKYIKACGCNENSKCLVNTTYKKLNGSNWVNLATQSDLSSFILNDGSTVTVIANFDKACLLGGTNYLNCKVIQFGIDVNGAKKPNTISKDFFDFWVLSSGKVIPCGAPQDGGDIRHATWGISNRLTGSGAFATYWVLTKGNQDYLTCANPGVAGGECDTKIKW